MPFNDLDAVERALAPGDVALLLTEPAMTNAGFLLPGPGFHDGLREMTRRHGTLLAIDETHTLVTAHGGLSYRVGSGTGLADGRQVDRRRGAAGRVRDDGRGG